MSCLTLIDAITVLSCGADRTEDIVLFSGNVNEGEADYEASLIKAGVRAVDTTPERTVWSLFDAALQAGVLSRDDFQFPPKPPVVYRVGRHKSDFTVPFLRLLVSTQFLRISSDDYPLLEPTGDLVPEFAVTFRGSSNSLPRILDTLNSELAI